MKDLKNEENVKIIKRISKKEPAWVVARGEEVWHYRILSLLKVLGKKFEEYGR